MKIGLGKRILMFLHWLYSLLLFAAVVIALFWPELIKNSVESLKIMMGSMSSVGFIVAGVVAGIIYLNLCIYQASMIFARGTARSERGFITVDSSDNSRVRIAISAIEQMVRQSVCAIDGISDMKVAIESADDAIDIRINASIISGCHVPTITMNMQQSIRKFVELNCGVAVKSVAVSINAVTAQDAAGHRKLRSKQASRPESAQVPFEMPVASVAPVAPVAPLEKAAPEVVFDESETVSANDDLKESEAIAPDEDEARFETIDVCKEDDDNQGVS